MLSVVMLSVVMLNVADDAVMLSSDRQLKVTPKSKLQHNSQNNRNKFLTSYCECERHLFL
jgi:hypothetical protein